jgi:nucleoside transporter
MTSAAAAPPLSLDLRIRLSIMMFLEFAVWGAWFVVLGNYLDTQHFSKTQVGTMYSLMPLGAILSTMFVGQIADRYFSSERLMAVLHLAGAGLLFWMEQIKDPAQFTLLAIVTLLYSLAYNPTLALSNSISFAHIPDGARDFPGIRVLGTIGWIAVNFLVGSVLDFHTNQPLLLAAGLSLALGLFSFALPHTPPAGQSSTGGPAFLRAFGLMKDFSFGLFFTVSLVITIVLAFYYSFTGQYLELAQAVKNVPYVMLIGQLMEMCFLPILPWFLRTVGMRWVLALGMASWGVRYLLFAFGRPDILPVTLPVFGTISLLVLVGVALHGFCFDFFFAAGFIHVDNTAPREIRASGQALFSFLTYGVGMYLGSELSGRVAQTYTNAAGQTDWSHFWIVPAVGVIISLAVFLIFFRPPKGASA